MKSSAVINLVCGSLLLLLCIHTMGEYSSQYQGIGLSPDKSIKPCKQEGYKIAFYPGTGCHAWEQSAGYGMNAALNWRCKELHGIDGMHLWQQDRMAFEVHSAIRVIGQWAWDGVVISDRVFGTLLVKQSLTVG